MIEYESNRLRDDIVRLVNGYELPIALKRYILLDVCGEIDKLYFGELKRQAQEILRVEQDKNVDERQVAEDGNEQGNKSDSV